MSESKDSTHRIPLSLNTDRHRDIRLHLIHYRILIARRMSPCSFVPAS